MKILIVVIFFLLFVISGCHKNNKLKNDIKSMYNKEIIFPDNLRYIKDGKTCSETIFASPIKIVSYLDSAMCTSCSIKDLIFWNDVLVDSVFKSIDVILILWTNNQMLTKALMKNVKLKHPYVLDINGEFRKKNLLKKWKFNHFLLDERNKIILIGNPTESNEIFQLYRKTISNYLKGH